MHPWPDQPITEIGEARAVVSRIDCQLGQQPAEEYMAYGDVFVLHSGPLEGLQDLTPEQWLYRYPANKFAAIITEVDLTQDLEEVASSVAVRNIGWSYVLATGDGFDHAGALAAEAALAAETSRIRLTTNVTQIVLRNPGVLAHQAATVDHISNGRAIAGLGAGVRTAMEAPMVAIRVGIPR